MGGFLYFVPDHVTRADQLGAYGLHYAFEESAGFAVCGCVGPEGVSGTIVGDDRGGQRIGYYPEKQAWRKVGQVGPAGRVGPCWVGIYKDAPPGPHDLLRRDALGGHAVRLLDGHDWIIPAALAWFEDGGNVRWLLTLPRRMDLDEAGQWTHGKVAPRYAELWRHAERFYDAFFAGSVTSDRSDQSDGSDRVTVHFSFQESGDSAVVGLGANYRLAAAEAALLGLLDDQVCELVLQAMIDLPTFGRLIKKKAASESTTVDGSDSCAGRGASTPTIGQPSPT